MVVHMFVNGVNGCATDVHGYLLCFEILFNFDFTCVLSSVSIRLDSLRLA